MPLSISSAPGSPDHPEPPFTLHQLRIFVAVAEAGAISAAADRLLLSQSAVALALGQLEKALGVELVVRRRAHGVTLTRSGTEALRQARAVLVQAGDFYEEFSGNGQLVGSVALGCYSSLSPSLVPQLVQGFLHEHPLARLTLEDGPQEGLDRDLRDGVLDLVISYDLDISDDLTKIVIAHRRPGVLVPSDGQWAGVDTIKLHELAEEPCVLFDTPMSTNHLMELAREAGFSPRVTYRSQNFETVRSLVGRGLGWALVVTDPHSTVTHEGTAVTWKPLAAPVAPVDVVITWPRVRPLARAARTFVTFTRFSLC